MEVIEMRRDPDQMSIFDTEPIAEYRVAGKRVIVRDLNSRKPAKWYEVLAHDKHEEPGETLIIQAVSINQAKFFYNDEAGHQYKCNYSIREVDI
jgi:hypothetical protein